MSAQQKNCPMCGKPCLYTVKRSHPKNWVQHVHFITDRGENAGCSQPDPNPESEPEVVVYVEYRNPRGWSNIWKW